VLAERQRNREDVEPIRLTEARVAADRRDLRYEPVLLMQRNAFARKSVIQVLFEIVCLVCHLRFFRVRRTETFRIGEQLYPME
jgi:hypothetical protein